MRAITAALILLFFLPSLAFPFFSKRQSSASNLAIGGGDLCSLTSPGVVLSNPASLGRIEGCFLGSAYKSYYGIEELACYSLSLVVPYRSVGAGICYESFGEVSFYREQEISLCLGGQVYRGILLGINLKYLQLSIDGGRFSREGTSGDVGLGYDSGGGLLLGLCWENLLAGEGLREDFDLDIITKFGIGVFPYENLYFSLSYFHGEDIGRWHFGQEISLSDLARLRCGLLSEPTRYTAGIGLNWQRFYLDLAYQSHPVLGATSQIDLGVRLFDRETR